MVCGCNGVTKASIGDAVLNKGCNTLGAIKSCTKASASCGGCKPIIENLLTYYAGDNVV
ncbi:(2Fe-2S)-binding protein [Pseudomonas koreensis]|uniref:(2Fe-2S)-binding protein n=1 Tax=Pseudomonas koreensis TaxID=198620 RepID=UPI001CC32976